MPSHAPGGWDRGRTGDAGRPRLVAETGGLELDERDVQALTQPFRGRDRTDRLGPGKRPGLSIVAAIAEMHGGRLELHALTEGGFQVLIELPLAPRDDAGAPA